jgi:hypothetical protein
VALDSLLAYQQPSGSSTDGVKVLLRPAKRGNVVRFTKVHRVLKRAETGHRQSSLVHSSLPFSARRVFRPHRCVCYFRSNAVSDDSTTRPPCRPPRRTTIRCSVTMALSSWSRFPTTAPRRNGERFLVGRRWAFFVLSRDGGAKIRCHRLGSRKLRSDLATPRPERPEACLASTARSKASFSSFYFQIYPQKHTSVREKW